MCKGFDKVCLGIERAKVGLITATLGKLFTLLDHDPEKLTPPLQRVIIHGGSIEHLSLFFAMKIFIFDTLTSFIYNLEISFVT